MDILTVNESVDNESVTFKVIRGKILMVEINDELVILKDDSLHQLMDFLVRNFDTA